MAAQILNVDPQKKDDMFYRYKMPSILTKIEGSGNGIKTVFPNIREVCQKLNRPPEVLNKFFGQELGAQSTHVKDDDKFLVMGSHMRDRIQDRVYDFINRLVLCKGCRNPETDPVVGSKGQLHLHCRSCGKDTDVSTERIVAFYVVHLQTVAEAAKKSKKASDKAAAAGEVEPAVAATTAPAAAAKPEGDPEIAVPSKPSKPAKIETTNESLQRENPIVLLANLMRQSPPVPTEKVIRTIITLKTDSALTEVLTVRLVWRGAIDGVDKTKFIGAAQQWAEVFKQVINRDEFQQVLLKEIASTCSDFNAPEKFPMVLKMFWEEGVLPEAEIKSFVATLKEGKSVKSKTMVEALKAQAKPFITWLAGDEEEQQA
jgi:translation initiation factor 5